MENSTNNTAVMTAEATTANKAVKAIGKVSGKIKKLVVSANVMALMFMLSAVDAFAQTGGNLQNGDGDEMFFNLIQFFATWIGRIGLVVGFVGAVMFGLAIKNDDADGKQRGLMTMAAGFIVFAITGALDMFGLTGANP